MISIQEKIDSLVEERALSLSGKITIEQNKVIAEEERDFIYQYLTRSAVNPDEYAILDILALMAKEINFIDNRSFSSPNLVLSQNAYSTSLMNKMIDDLSSPNGDGFYASISDQEFNESSRWLSNNGMSSTSDYDNSSIGIPAGLVVAKVVEIRAAREDKDTEGHYTHRDSYDSTLEILITDLIDALNNLASFYTDKLESIYISSSSNPFLTNPDSYLDLPVGLEGYGITISGFEADLQSFLNTLQGTYNRTTFDGLLGFEGSPSSIETKLEEIKTSLLERVSFLMESFNGDLTTGIRKQYYFWIQLMLGKPQSTLVSVQGLSIALSNTITSLAKKKKQLEILFESDYEKFLPTPSISAVFRDEENRIIILVNSLPCFSRIIIYRKEILSTSDLSNDAYGAEYEVSSIDLPEVTLSFQDESSIEVNKLYSYRVKIQDMSSIDIYDSGSDQSLAYETASYSYTKDLTGFVLTLGEHELSSGQYIYIPTEGIFLVISRTSSSITVNREVTANGILHRANGIFAS
jgi:hypothetical protein